MAEKCIVYVFVSWNRREEDAKFAQFHENQPNKLNLAHVCFFEPKVFPTGTFDDVVGPCG